MESRFQTSFIPKKPLEPVSSDISRKIPLGLFFNLSVFITILMLLAAGALFAYSKILDGQISGKVKSLADSQKQFDSGLVNQLKRLNNRITTAQTLLNNHIGFSVFFNLLGNGTLKAIQYTSFNYSYAGPDKIAVSMKGIAKDYSVVAVQSDVLSNAQRTLGAIKSPIFSDLNLDASGNVAFSFSAFIDPNLISYKKNLQANLSQAEDASTTVSATETPTASPQSNIITNP